MPPARAVKPFFASCHRSRLNSSRNRIVQPVDFDMISSRRVAAIFQPWEGFFMLHRTAAPLALAVTLACASSLRSSAARTLPPGPPHRPASGQRRHRTEVRARHWSSRPRRDPRPVAGRGRRRAAEAGAGRLAALAPLLPPAPPAAGPRGHRCARTRPRTTPFLRSILEPQPGRTVTVTRTATGWTAQEEAAGHRHLVLAARRRSGDDLFDDLRSRPACRPAGPGLGPDAGA